jgi:hypothetical protein
VDSSPRQNLHDPGSHRLPPEVRDEPSSVVDAPDDVGDGGTATLWCKSEAEANPVFADFLRNIETEGYPMPEPN